MIALQFGCLSFPGFYLLDLREFPGWTVASIVVQGFKVPRVKNRQAHLEELKVAPGVKVNTDSNGITRRDWRIISL